MPFSELIPISQEETKISGTLIVGNCNALAEIVGARAYDGALAGLESELRERLVHATALSWVSIPDMEQLIMGCADEAGRDVFGLNVEMTRLSTERSFRTVWRVLLRFATDKLILSRTAAAYSRAYDRGRLSVRVDGSSRGECQIHERPGMSRMTREAFGVGVETVLRVGGRGNARVTSRPTADGAVYTVRRMSALGVEPS